MVRGEANTTLLEKETMGSKSSDANQDRPGVFHAVGGVQWITAIRMPPSARDGKPRIQK